jgi:hypothetical protein
MFGNAQMRFLPSEGGVGQLFLPEESADEEMPQEEDVLHQDVRHEIRVVHH